MLETHRLPESARFVEADSESVKSAKRRKDAGFGDSESAPLHPLCAENSTLSGPDFAVQNNR